LQKQQPRLDPKRLVFIDETSVSTTITRLYGRAPQGERLVQKVPHGNWKTVTFIAALRHDRVTAPFVLEGPMTGEMFKAYTEQFLAPTLARGDIVFMDNVRAFPEKTESAWIPLCQRIRFKNPTGTEASMGWQSHIRRICVIA